MRYRYYSFSIDLVNILREDTCTGELMWVDASDGYSRPMEAWSKLHEYQERAVAGGYTVTEITDRFLPPQLCVPEGL